LRITIIYSAIALLLAILPFSCTKEGTSKIPYVYVDYYLYPNTLDYIPQGGTIIYDGGYRGIIIYRASESEFMVYERCCPYDPENANAYVEPEPGGLTVIDSVCMSGYILTDGSPYKGPSNVALRQYHYSYNGEVLHIYN